MDKRIKYNWKEIQELYELGLSYRDLIKRFGMSSATLTNARKRGDLIIRSRVEANCLAKRLKPQFHSKETREKLSEIRVNALRNKAFYSKRYKYNDVILDSSYELIVAKSLDENKIKWIRPKSLKWNDNGYIRRYIPDFYLIDFDIFLDPKNDYLIKKDKRKIESAQEFNNVKILILDKTNLLWDNIKRLIDKFSSGSET